MDFQINVEPKNTSERVSPREKLRECVLTVRFPLCIHRRIRITESLCHIANVNYEGATIRLSFSSSLSSPTLTNSLTCLSPASTLTLSIVQLHYRRTGFPKFGKLGICKPGAQYSSAMKAVCAINPPSAAMRSAPSKS